MRRVMISLATLVMVVSCSKDRERRGAAAPDTVGQAVAVTPADTSASPAEEQASSASATRATSRPRPAKTRHRTVAVQPSAKRPVPRAATRDPAVPKDTTPAPSAGYAPSRDTLPDPAPDSATGVGTAAAQGADSGVDSMRQHDTATAPPAVPAPASTADQNTHTLPAGTEIRAVLNDSIDSRRDSAGRVLLARVAGDVTDPSGATVVPAGSEVQFTITQLEPAKSRSASDGKLSLRVDAITLDGRPVPVNATVKPVPHELRGRGVTPGEVEKVGVGTAAGAVAGQVITGKTRGAVVGAVVGAAGGAVVAAQTASRDVVVHSGTTAVFTLEAPLVASAP
jgi:hypothetical protein